jgi:hypothetical protein
MMVIVARQGAWGDTMDKFAYVQVFNDMTWYEFKNKCAVSLNITMNPYMVCLFQSLFDHNI